MSTSPILLIEDEPSVTAFYVQRSNGEGIPSKTRRPARKDSKNLGMENISA